MMFTVLMIQGLDPPVFIVDLVSETGSVDNCQLHLHTPFFKHCKDTQRKHFFFPSLISLNRERGRQGTELLSKHAKQGAHLKH